MSWLAVLLVAIGLADLVRSIRADAVLAAVAGAAGAVALGLGSGMVALGEVLVVLGLAGVVVAWELTAAGALRGARSAVPALSVLAGAVAVLVAFSAQAPVLDGPVASWVRASQLAPIAGHDPATVVLVLGLGLVQLSTGNTVVRLVLAATGTVRPGGDGAESELKGGRMLGPMERLTILGLGLAGHVTAASIVIAAKGLIRWPELQSKRDARAAGQGPDIDEITEYFLVGSFVSWLVALASLVLAGSGPP